MTRSEPSDLQGMLIVDKPAGMTSHDVVAALRRMLGIRRVGHGGTLDPFATGILVVAVGRATKLLQYIQNSNKRYLATLKLGASTNTLDRDGIVTAEHVVSAWPTPAHVEDTLGRFTGVISQVPPAHSAIKIDGRKLYELARAGQPITPPSRQVEIHAIRVVEYMPPRLVIDVSCSKGTYIRSLARDIGDALGTLAYCDALRRTENGPFTIDMAWPLEAFAERDLRRDWRHIALRSDSVLVHLPRTVLDGDAVESWYHGRLVEFDGGQSDNSSETWRVYDDDDAFLGLGVASHGNTLRPTLVFTRARVVDGGRQIR